MEYMVLADVFERGRIRPDIYWKLYSQKLWTGSASQSQAKCQLKKQGIYWQV
jgi:hypothetical protein